MPGRVKKLRRRAAVALLLVPIALAMFAGSTAHAAVQPNVVVIMTDDQTVRDLSYLPKTSNLVAAQGVNLKNFYASYPLCCPSRATYLTGQYAHNNGVQANADEGSTPGGYARLNHDHALPKWLQDAGYDTAHIGKYLNGYGYLPGSSPTDVPDGWTEWYGAPGPNAYTMYEFDLLQQDHQQDQDGNCIPNVPPGSAETVHYPAEEANYQTDVYSDIAHCYITRHASDPDPFFLSIAPLAPHNDLLIKEEGGFGPEPPLRYLGYMSGLALPRPPNFNEKDISDKPRYIRKLARLSSEKIRLIKEGFRRRLESLLAVDDLVEDVVEKLDNEGVLDNTYIFFTSDNGYTQGNHRRAGGKIVPYEESARVPLLVRGPGIPAGGIRPQLSANVDLAPTIAEIAGADPTRPVDGLSLLPVLKDNASLFRPILLEAFTGHEYTAIRSSKWKYIRNETKERELYNLQKDPYELKNLLRSKSKPAKKIRKTAKRLSKRLKTLQRCAGVGCQQ